MVFNAREISLTSVICRGTRTEDYMITIYDRIVWNPPIQGPTFIVDSNTVLIFLKELCHGKNGDTWIKGIPCVSATTQTLHQYYGGDVDSYKPIQAAKHNNEYIFYNMEIKFSFEEYCSSSTIFLRD